MATGRRDTFGLFSVPAPLFALAADSGVFSLNARIPCQQFMKTYWTLTDTVARLEEPNFAGEVDLLFPWHGFLLEVASPGKIALMKVHTRAAGGATPETLVDSYQRGADLVATYAQTPERNIRPQLYWRYVEPRGLELILSAQTSLLDSQPATTIESALPAGEALPLSASGQVLSVSQDQWHTSDDAPRAVLFRPQGYDVSYVEMVHPTDFAGIQLSVVDQLPTVRWHLFPERLEKGVIRRGRVRGVLVSREDDLHAAQQALAAFATSPLTLST